MKLSCIFLATLLAILVPVNSSTGQNLQSYLGGDLHAATGSSEREDEMAVGPGRTDEEARAETATQGIADRVHTLQVAGSRLPDCSHACGSCSPCRLMLVASTCAALAEAEPCPISYRCMCKNKSYPVP